MIRVQHTSYTYLKKSWSFWFTLFSDINLKKIRVSCFEYYVVASVAVFEMYPIFLSLSLLFCRASLDNVFFPSVTLCNINQGRRSFFLQNGLNQVKTKFKIMLEKFDKIWIYLCNIIVHKVRAYNMKGKHGMLALFANWNKPKTQMRKKPTGRRKGHTHTHLLALSADTTHAEILGKCQCHAH